MPIYARLGIPELWQCEGLTVQYYLLKDDEYEAVQISPTFPNLPAPAIDIYMYIFKSTIIDR